MIIIPEFDPCSICGGKVFTFSSKTREWECDNCKRIAPEKQDNAQADYIASLESQLADAQARLAGFDPATKLPEFGTKVLVETPLLGGYSSFDFATYRADNTWQSETTAYRELRGITRWFPLPGSKGGAE